MTGEHPETQSHYQVRFDRGERGARAIAVDADVLVWADALGAPTPPTVPNGTLLLVTAHDEVDGVGTRVLERQQQLGRRCIVAVVAAGDRYADGEFRAAVEDDLLAGAVVDMLAARGVDFHSPEAAVVAASAAALRRAVGHLTSASVSARVAADTESVPRIGSRC